MPSAFALEIGRVAQCVMMCSAVGGRWHAYCTAKGGLEVAELSYRLQKDEPLTDALHRIAREQVSRALREIDESRDLEDAVHSVRQRCKKIRALLRLVREGLGDTYREENRAVRDAGRLFASVRDADVVLAIHRNIVHRVTPVVDSRRLALVRRALGERLPPRSPELSQNKRNELLQTFSARLKEIGQRIEDWKIEGSDGYVLSDGLKRTYGRARDGAATALDTRQPECFHEWRKGVKYHGYHLRLMQGLSDRGSLKRRRRQMDRLGDHLGDAHDLTVYQSWLDRTEAVGAVAQVVDVLHSLAFEQRIDNERRALSLGGGLFEAKPGKYARVVVG